MSTPTTEQQKQQALNACITRSEHPDLPEPYRGKVRDVYELGGDRLGIVVTDRISAFDHIMRQAIPYKGQILNQLSEFGFSQVEDIMPTHVLAVRSEEHTSELQ